MLRKLSLFLSLFLMVSLFAVGCGQQPSAKDSAPPNESAGNTATAASTPIADSSLVTDPGAFPVVNEKMTFTFFAPQSTYIEDIYTNDFTVMYEEKTNVHIEWELAPEADLSNQTKLSLASGVYPDAYFACGLSQGTVMEYADKLFIPLNDLIDQYSMYFKKELDSLKYAREMITLPNGNIYALPATTYEESHLLAPNKYWINTSWLTKLNLEAPKTTDELYAVLQAFKNDDPNGNNQKDEIPLTLPSAYTASWFMCSFIYDDGGNRIRILDGDVVDPVFNKQEWKNGILWLKKLYDEGLTDSTAFTETPVIELVENGDTEVVGMAQGLWQGAFANIDGERQAHYDALPPVKGPAGVQTTYTNPYMHSTGTMAITTKCEHPEVLIRWVDWLYDLEGGLTARTGKEGVNWQRVTDGSLSYTGEPATWERLTSYATAQNVCWNGIVFPQRHSFHNELKGYADKFYEAAGMEDRLYKYTEDYSPCLQKKVLPPFYVDPSVATEYYKLQADINKYVNESFVQFITGGIDVATGWEGYLAQLNTIGLDRYVELTQQGYTAFINSGK